MEVVDLGDAVLLRPGDELDLLGYMGLEEAVRNILHEGRNRAVIDLKDVRYISSSAIAVLVRLGEEMRASGGGLALVGARGGAQISLDVTGASGDVPVFESLDEAQSFLAKADKTGSAGTSDTEVRA